MADSNLGNPGVSVARQRSVPDKNRPGKNKIDGAADYAHFFEELGRRIRKLRESAGRSEADMSAFGFSARYWQQIEAGRPTAVSTLLRICGAFKTELADLLQGLDHDANRN